MKSSKKSDNPPLNPEDVHDAEVIKDSIITTHKEMELSLSGKTIHGNTSNALQVLNHNDNFNGNIWFDEFHQKIFTTYNPDQDDFGKTVREWEEEDDIRLSIFMQQELKMSTMSDDTVNKAIRVYARKHVKNEPRDWMSNLVWDQKPRIETFLIDCAGVIDNEYTRAVSKNFWLSIVARVFSPGCKVDTMPILEGEQGKYKSTLLQVIGGKLHCEASHDIKHKDFFQGLHGKLIIEFADLSSFTKTEINLIKDILVRRTDHIRLPYAKLYKDFPRQSVFSGTTNNTTYLKDYTGARRFWPVKTNKIDIPRAKDERDQLFAEAVYILKQGQEWWNMPEQTMEEQEERREIDPWEDTISSFLAMKEEITSTEILKDCLHFDNKQPTKADQMRIGSILKLLKWERTQKWFGTVRKWVYSRPIDIALELPDQSQIDWEN